MLYNECGEKMDLLTQGQKIIKKINDAGYEAFLVGGVVRDYLLGIPVKDVDITTSATPYVIESLFDKTIPTGKAFGTITVIKNKESFEVTTYRTDGTYLNHRKPESIKFSNDVNDDLKRRDFTINQLRMDAELNVLDAFNGRSDLNQKIIRTIHNPNDRFKEDALRMIRAFRFSAKLGFRIEEETLNSIQANASLIQKISIERIQDEFKKMLDYEVLKPTVKLMIDTGFAKACFDLDQGLKYLLNVGELNPFERIYRVSLGIDFKKAPWKFPLKTLKKIADYNDLIKAFDTLHPRLFLNYPKTLIFEVADYLKKTSSINKIKELETLYEGLIIKDKKDLKINGKTIDEVLKPKDKSLIKTILNELYDKVLEGSLKNTKDALIQEVKTRKQGL